MIAAIMLLLILGRPVADVGEPSRLSSAEFEEQRRAQPALPEDTVRFLLARNGRVYFDLPERLMRKGDVVDTWIYVVQPSPLPTRSKSVSYSLQRMRLDCRGRSVEDVTMTAYDAEGSVVMWVIPKDPPSPVGGIEEAIAALYCDAGVPETARLYRGYRAAAEARATLAAP